MPCKPGMSGCYRGCRHRAFVQQYRDARTAGEEARDEAVGSYGEGSPEWQDYQPPPVTFRTWLEQMAGWGGSENDRTP